MCPLSFCVLTKICKVGNYLVDNWFQDECKPCKAGKYNDVKGSFKCSNCVSGQYQNELGSSECKLCHTVNLKTLLFIRAIQAI